MILVATSAHTELVLSFEDARSLVLEHAQGIASLQTRSTESLPLLAALGRVLAQPVVADRDLPPFARATRDGFAVRASDVARAAENNSVRLRVVAEVAAGTTAALPEIKEGESAEIMTGAPVPLGADAVVMVEHTQPQADSVSIQRAVRSGENIVPRGAEGKRGTQLLATGARIDHAAIAVAASVGCAKVQVFGKPRIALLSTGDELVEVNTQPGEHQIRNSNSFSLAAQILESCAEPVQLPIARDNRASLRDLIRQGLQADLLLLSGGVSMGTYDLVEQVLAESGAEIFLTGALIQPGRPIVFGRVRSSAAQPNYFFGLPGNPVSTMVTFKLFVRLVVDAFAGTQPSPLPFVQVKLKSEIKTKTGLTRFLPGHLSGNYHQSQVELVRWQGSGDIVATAAANCYVVIPPDRDRIAAGEMISVLLP